MKTLTLKVEGKSREDLLAGLQEIAFWIKQGLTGLDIVVGDGMRKNAFRGEYEIQPDNEEGVTPLPKMEPGKTLHDALLCQWKGSAVCLDFHCPKCAEHTHLDEQEFAFAIRCPKCNATYRVHEDVTISEIEKGYPFYDYAKPYK